jgi:hypothetical protein
MRARLLARAGDVSAAEAMAREAVELASLTDASCSRAEAHFSLAEVLELAGDRAGATAEENAARELLHLKGAKGALVGAPFA